MPLVQQRRATASQKAVPMSDSLPRLAVCQAVPHSPATRLAITAELVTKMTATDASSLFPARPTDAHREEEPVPTAGHTVNPRGRRTRRRYHNRHRWEAREGDVTYCGPKGYAAHHAVTPLAPSPPHRCRNATGATTSNRSYLSASSGRFPSSVILSRDSSAAARTPGSGSLVNSLMAGRADLARTANSPE